VQLFLEKISEKIPDNIYPSSNAGFTMQELVCFENYPSGFIIASNLVSLLMYIIGAFLLYELWPLLVIPYLLFILLLEYRLLSGHCTDCWYYGNAWAFGTGWLSACRNFFSTSCSRFIRRVSCSASPASSLHPARMEPASRSRSFWESSFAVRVYIRRIWSTG